ncbi:hypothetical protein [Bradyrhizobium sp. JYMT SZCCT0428]|uniref:hypothetical protein n=1 Tax=Bradyrhizobium sp. JYMT SZCCT0428 TaxID=2807673 RepID=UPI001BAB9F13|nr:hypothetical protein [Bradyrhizobium sp. JYMT SZCCT0428]MBR1151577.1 hypothetical protein [Bradyrhizobium sp. JYMT SZCCT0428]
MIARFAVALLLWGISPSAFAHEISIEFSWDGATPCKTLSANPRMVIRGFPKEAKRVMLILTQGKNPRGGQEIDLPSSGIIPPKEVWTMGVCNPDVYRWTAIFKAANGTILAQTHTEKPFP